MLGKQRANFWDNPRDIGVNWVERERGARERPTVPITPVGRDRNRVLGAHDTYK